ncbi:phosphotransferase KptA/Tpt1 [Spinellus fusiger]|nr:phosphotransferase KptA/Tpt1 [Spinellus fusiger]
MSVPTTSTTDVPPLTIHQEIRLSKVLSYMLRHGAIKENLPLRSDGYLALSALVLQLAHSKLRHVTPEQVQWVVKVNDKQRFHLLHEQDQWWIRANQGHTIEIKDLVLERIDTDVFAAIHGTTYANWELIKTEGLKTMARQHIHLGAAMPNKNKILSGIRPTSEVFIHIDTQKAKADGIEFYRSQNGVILTQGKDKTLAPIYFARVYDQKEMLLM